METNLDISYTPHKLNIQKGNSVAPNIWYEIWKKWYIIVVFFCEINERTKSIVMIWSR